MIFAWTYQAIPLLVLTCDVVERADVFLEYFGVSFRALRHHQLLRLIAIVLSDDVWCLDLNIRDLQDLWGCSLHCLIGRFKDAFDLGVVSTVAGE